MLGSVPRYYLGRLKSTCLHKRTGLLTPTWLLSIPTTYNSSPHPNPTIKTELVRHTLSRSCINTALTYLPRPYSHNRTSHLTSKWTPAPTPSRTKAASVRITQTRALTQPRRSSAAPQARTRERIALSTRRLYVSHTSCLGTIASPPSRMVWVRGCCSRTWANIYLCTDRWRTWHVRKSNGQGRPRQGLQLSLRTRRR
jgi:hypothetical protein